MGGPKLRVTGCKQTQMNGEYMRRKVTDSRPKGWTNNQLVMGRKAGAWEKYVNGEWWYAKNDGRSIFCSSSGCWYMADSIYTENGDADLDLIYYDGSKEFWKNDV